MQNVKELIWTYTFDFILHLLYWYIFPSSFAAMTASKLWGMDSQHFLLVSDEVLLHSVDKQDFKASLFLLGVALKNVAQCSHENYMFLCVGETCFK